jgi:hypothetical protein
MIAESQSLVTSTPTATGQKPKQVWDGILYEFQVFYFAAGGNRIEEGELRSMLVRAETASQAAWHLEQAGLRVSSIGTGRPLVDWGKTYFTRKELQALSGLKETATSEAITSGELQESSVRGVFSKGSVEEWLG